MREAVMSAALWPVAEVERLAEREQVAPEKKVLRPVAGWNPESFAREQMRRLVRQLFASNSPDRKRQVVFSAADAETDISSICLRAGEALAAETLADVAVVLTCPEAADDEGKKDFANYSGAKSRYAPLRMISRQLRRNLWLVPANEGREPRSAAFLQTYFGEVRREFEYSIVQCRSAGESNEAAAIAQVADGIILVLSALRTRRAAAGKIKQSLEESQARLLGTILSDREFPIPEGVYRRL